MVERKITSTNRGFKGVWIPADVWLDENLTTQEMLFLIEIDSLDISDKGCYASNKHFSEFFGVSSARCSQIINSLQSKGYISISFIYGKNKVIEKRTIRVLRKLTTPIKYSKGGYLENAKGSNTSLSNTKEYMSSKLDGSIPYKKIIDYLNERTNKNYKVTQKWKDLIKARWNEGQSYDDFVKVIDTKTKQWLGDPNMDKYLRPATLFGNKFDDYLNEYQPTKKSKNNLDDFENINWDEIYG